MILSIKQKIEKLKQFETDAARTVIGLVKENEAEVLDANTQEQLFEKGETAEGQPIAPGYRPLTVTIKRQKGQPTNRVTLRDTGDFHRSFFVNYGDNYFAIGAKDDKAEKLERKYGKEIFGLNEENLQDLINRIKPDLIEKFRTAVL